MTRVRMLFVGLMTVLSGPAWAGVVDAGLDCGIEEYRCDAECSCEARFDEAPCNDLPNGTLGVSYPTAADPVEVLCPSVFMSGAADPESPNNMFYRVEISRESAFAVLVYDSGLVTANPGTTEHHVGNDLYPRPLEAGGNYWLRVTDNDDCSSQPDLVYYANPNPLLVNFTVADSPLDNCTGGGDADTDADTDADIDADVDADGGGGGGGGSAGCRTTGGPAAGVLSFLVLMGLAIIALRRR